MCGIAGKLYWDRHHPVDPDLLKRMTDEIAHRGPDGEGYYLSGGVGLGHRRLSIIDLSTGDQPMSNEDGTVWVVYNGEIYNFPELRSELEARGHTFKSSTDTEVIVHLYEEVGLDAVVRFRGMFAFALWDERKRLLLLARDRVGIKPLYYTSTGNALLFASEIKSMLIDPTVRRSVNLGAIDRFLTYYYLPGSETLFDGIHKLDPGHYLTAQDGRVGITQYWDLSFSETPGRKSYDSAVEALQELLSRTVKDHMISDVPVGVLLSGGVDSTGVLRYAVAEAERPIHTFTIGFEGSEVADERPFARLAAECYGTIHQDMTMRADDFRDFLPKFIWHMEEPVCEPPAVALYFVSRLARESSIKVLLSGEGGDEAFGGYQNYRNLLLLETVKSAFGRARSLLQLGIKGFGLLGIRRVGRYGDLIMPALSEYYYSRTATPTTAFNRRKRWLYTEEFANSLGDGVSDGVTRRLFDKMKNQSPLNCMLYVDTKSWLPDDLLVKADKMTMATSVELRVPLLDFQVLEFAASLPPHFKVQGWATKRILKSALKESVPKEILQRKKTGFPVPYERWLKKDLKDFVLDTVSSQLDNLTGYFNKSNLLDLIHAQENGDGCSQEVFSLLILALWHQQFLMKSPLN